MNATRTFLLSASANLGNDDDDNDDEQILLAIIVRIETAAIQRTASMFRQNQGYIEALYGAMAVSITFVVLGIVVLWLVFEFWAGQFVSRKLIPNGPA